MVVGRELEAPTPRIPNVILKIPSVLGNRTLKISPVKNNWFSQFPSFYKGTLKHSVLNVKENRGMGLRVNTNAYMLQFCAVLLPSAGQMVLNV